MITVDANVWVAALDRRDTFYSASRTFLVEVARRQLRIILPVFTRIEVACALSRRRQNPAAGVTMTNHLLASAYVVQVPLDSQLLDHTLLTGTRSFLRSADALYAAVAQLYQTQLVSWDDEMLQRAGGVTPRDWLATHPA